MRGTGYSFEALPGWAVSHSRAAAVARSGPAAVSVTVFPLRRAYDPAGFDALTKTLDGVAGRLARAAGTSVSHSETLTTSGEKIRAYRYGVRRIGFAFRGRQEYQLYCTRDGDGCDVLFSSFMLTG